MTLYPISKLRKDMFRARQKGKFRVIASREELTSLNGPIDQRDYFKLRRFDAPSLKTAWERVAEFNSFPRLPGPWAFQIFDHYGRKYSKP